MEQTTSTKKKYFGYILYSTLLIVGLLYYRFPADALRDYLQSYAGRVPPGFVLSVGKVSPSLNFGLKFFRSKLSLRSDPDMTLFNASSLLIKTEVWSLLRGKFKYCFNCTAYSGDLKGCVHFRKKGVKAPFTTSMELKDIRIDEHKYLSVLIGREIKGVLTGTVSFSGQYDFLADSTGEASLRISDGRIPLFQPILNLDYIDFDQISIKLVLKNQKIDLTQVELKGREMHGTLSGKISLKRDFLKSRLDLKGTVEPFAAFFKSAKGTRSNVKTFKQRLKKGKLTFVVHGTLTKPEIEFI